MQAHLQIARWLAESRHAVAFTGAGISTESGIPDFRSPGGIWTKYRTIYFQEFLASGEARLEYWRQKAEGHIDMSRAELHEAFALSRKADLFLAIGSSLVVEPAASLPCAARESGSRLVIINRDATPLDALADIVLREPIGETLRAIAGENRVARPAS